MAARRAKRDRSTDETPQQSGGVSALEPLAGLSEEILQEYSISPGAGTQPGFVRLFVNLLRSRPNVPWTREEIGAELERLAGRRPAPSNFDRLLQTSVRARYLVKMTHNTTGARVWVAPPVRVDPEEMVAHLNSLSRSSRQEDHERRPPDEDDVPSTGTEER